MNKYTIMWIVAVIVFGAGGFYGGMKYQESKSPNMMIGQLGTSAPRVGMQGGQMMQKGQNGNVSMSIRPVIGKIVASDDSSITVELEDGSSKIILLSDETVIHEAESVTKDQLVEGETISVLGQEDNDGIVSAQTIQLNPVLQKQIGR